VSKFRFLFSYGLEFFSARALKEILEAEIPCSVELFPDVTALENRFAQLGEADLVIYDSPLPALSCIRSLRRLLKHGIEIPAVLLTAIPDCDAIDNALSAGFSEVFYKPVDWELMVNTIVELINKQPQALQNKG
jgi:DNA-binding NtrC family response regulator